MENPFPLNFAYAYGEPSSHALFRSKNEDFVVEEELGFSPSGDGEHLIVHIKKRGENTQWVAEKLAKFFGVKNMDVGFCGMKDRNAVTSQWFSVYVRGNRESVNWSEFIEQFELNIDVLSSSFHAQKLRRGAHKSNVFTICLRQVAGIDVVESKLEKVKLNGVPNYFGEQRFGRNSSNLVDASAWVSSQKKIRNKNKRSIVMSAARSFLFNRYLSARVEAGNWNFLVDGDEDLNGCPSGALWGRGKSASKAVALQIEEGVLQPYAAWCDHLEHVGLNQERRSLVLSPIGLSWQREGEDLVIRFGLSSGEYATSVLREICVLNNQSA